MSYGSETYLTLFLNNDTNKKNATFKSFENPRTAVTYTLHSQLQVSKDLELVHQYYSHFWRLLLSVKG